MGVIYKISFCGSDRLYVGSAIDFARRKSEHIKQLRNGSHANKPLLRAFAKYGEVNINFDVLEYVSSNDDLISAEQAWIDSFDYRAHLYNTCRVAGSTFGIRKTAEEKAKIAAYAKTRTGCKNPFWGKQHSDRAKAAVSLANSGRKQPKEVVRRRVESIKTKYGKHPNALKVQQIDPKTNEVLAIWDSMEDAAKNTKANISTISMICNQTPKLDSRTDKYHIPKTSGGYKWSFA